MTCTAFAINGISSLSCFGRLIWESESFTSCLPLCWGTLQTSVWNRWEPKRLLYLNAWEWFGNLPWPPHCRNLPLDSPIASWFDGNFRLELGIMLCIKWHFASLILILFKNDEGVAWNEHEQATLLWEQLQFIDHLLDWLDSLCVETWRCWCASNALICWSTHSRQQFQQFRPSSVDSGPDWSEGVPKVKSE